jgi:hypothetical protein
VIWGRPRADIIRRGPLEITYTYRIKIRAMEVKHKNLRIQVQYDDTEIRSTAAVTVSRL